LRARAGANQFTFAINLRRVLMKDNNQSMNVRYQAKAKQEVKKPYDPPTAVFVPTEVEGRMLAKCKPGGAFCLKSPFA